MENAFFLVETALSKKRLKAPEKVSLSMVSPNGICVSWRSAPNGALGFMIERSGNGRNFMVVAKVPWNLKSWFDQGLTSGTRYYYRIVAYGIKGASSYSRVASVSTPVVG